MSSENKNKTLAMVVIGIIIAAVIASAGTYYFMLPSAPGPTAITTTASTTGREVIIPEKEPPKPKSLRIIGIQPEGSFLEVAARKFTEETGIEIIWESAGWGQLHEKYAVMYATGEYTKYDVMYQTVPWLRDVYFYFVPMNKYMKEVGWPDGSTFEDLDPITLALAAMPAPDSPEYYQMPYSAEPHIFYWNTEMFSAAGLNPEKAPEGWDQFMEYAQKLTKDTDGDGKIDQWGWAASFDVKWESSNLFITQLNSLGGHMFDSSDNPTFNNEKGREALQRLVDAMNKYKVINPSHLVDAGGEDATEFVSGRAAMIQTWSDMAYRANDPAQSKIAGKWRVGVIPVKASFFSEQSWAMPWTTPERQYWAWKFIAFTTSAAFVRDAIKQGQPFIIPRQSLLADKTLVNAPGNEWVKAIVDTIESQAYPTQNLKTIENVPHAWEVILLTGEYFNEAVSGKRGVDQTLNDLEAFLIEKIRE